MEGTQQKFALMVDFGHDCLVRDDHPGELDPRSQRIYAGDFLRELLVKNVLDAYKQALEQAQTNSQTQSQTSGNQTMQQM